MTMTTENQRSLFLIRGAIASLSEPEQLAINAMATQVREIVGRDKELGTLAVTLVVAELAAEVV